MPIAISDTHRELESVARSFLESAKARAEARALLDAPDEKLPAFWDDLVGLGWLGLHLPESVGGSGYGLPELVVVLQELGRAVAPGPFLPTVLASAVIATAGTEEQQAALLPTLADGTKTGALGFGDTVLGARPRRRDPDGRRRRRRRGRSRRRGCDREGGRQPRPDPPQRRRALRPRGRARGARVARRGKHRARHRTRSRIGRGRGWRAGVRRPRHRVRQAARAVRPRDRDVPGGEAPLRQHARRFRARHRRRVGRRARQQAAATSSRSRRQLPRCKPCPRSFTTPR